MLLYNRNWDAIWIQIRTMCVSQDVTSYITVLEPRGRMSPETFLPLIAARLRQSVSIRICCWFSRFAPGNRRCREGLPAGQRRQRECSVVVCSWKDTPFQVVQTIEIQKQKQKKELVTHGRFHTHALKIYMGAIFTPTNCRNGCIVYAWWGANFHPQEAVFDP